MILLEFHNRIVAETLTSRYEAFTESGKAPGVDITIADFDGVLFHLVSGEDKNKITVSVGLKFYHELQQYGVDELMARVYGNRLVEAESGFDCSVLVDLETLGDDAAAVINEVARLRRNCFAAVFEYFFKKYEAKDTDGESAMIHYRDQETMYVSAHKDRVTVVFSTLFSDADDVVIGKVFLQEFKEGRRGNQQAPQVIFSHKDPPAELQDSSALTGDNVGYVTFVLFPRHIQSKVADSTIDLIHTFRDYLHYHIKCSKAYLHQRMRARTASLLKILNRARPESETKERKTATGKTFRRS